MKSQVPESVSIESKQSNVAILLSGGVDSSVALHRLVSRGYNCTGLFERNFNFISNCGFSTLPYLNLDLF